MKAFLANKLFSQFEAVGSLGTGVPKVLAQLASTVASSGSSTLKGVNASSAASAALQVGSRILGQVAAPPPEEAAKWLRGSAQGVFVSSAQSGLDASNDVFSALGLPIRIVQPTSENARVRVVIPPSEGSVMVDDDRGATSRRLGPRQFVRFMREARKDQQLGKDCIEVYIRQMSEAGRLKPIPMLSKRFQYKLYEDIARMIIFAFQRCFLTLDNAVLWGHLLKVRSHPSLGFCPSKKTALGDAQLDVIVDQMLASQAVRLPLCPKPLERRLYSNCMLVVFQLVEDLLTGQGQEVCFMGHRLRFELQAEPVELVRRVLEEQPLALCRINEAVLAELVDELLSDAETNIVWMPDAIESQLYLSVMRLLVRIVEHVVGRLKINVLGRQINMSLRSQVDLRARQAYRVGQHAQAVTYFEDEDPLRTLSTNELEERLKDLDDQRRLLVALQELGSSDFDLTAEVPMVQEMERGAEGAHDGSAASTDSATKVVPKQEEEGREVHEFQRLAATLKLARSLSMTFEVAADIEVPHSMIADLETYPLWMPWCTSGASRPPAARKEAESEVKVFHGEVGFGFETGTFLGTVGDTVSYQVSVRPPAPNPTRESIIQGRVTADAVNGFTYGKRLVYDWRFQSARPRQTKVELDILFEARSVIYMPVWDGMQHMVVNGMLSAFINRALVLQKARDALAKPPEESPAVTATEP